MSEDNENTNTNGKGEGEGTGAGTPSGAPAANPAAELAAASDATATANTRADTATAAYLTACRSANPAIPDDLITGDTIEAIDASITAGQATVDQVIAANAKQPPPGNNAGAPPRSQEPPGDLRGSGLISWALENEKSE